MRTLSGSRCGVKCHSLDHVHRGGLYPGTSHLEKQLDGTRDLYKCAQISGVFGRSRGSVLGVGIIEPCILRAKISRGLVVRCRSSSIECFVQYIPGWSIGVFGFALFRCACSRAICVYGKPCRTWLLTNTSCALIALCGGVVRGRSGL